jgi:hypothetical protein
MTNWLFYFMPLFIDNTMINFSKYRVKVLAYTAGRYIRPVQIITQFNFKIKAVNLRDIFPVADELPSLY